MSKRIASFLISLLLTAVVFAQGSGQGYFNHMNLGVELSSTGLGLNVSMPVGDYVRLRTGFTWMPEFRVNTDFGMQLSNDPTGSDGKLDKMCEMMSEFTGTNVDKSVTMNMSPSWWSYKFLVDILPFKNKHWSFTVGFHLSPSVIASAVNKPSEGSTVTGLCMYNNMYEHALMGIPYEFMGHTVDFFTPEIVEKFDSYGMMGVPLGHFSNGDLAIMVPDGDGSVNATLEVNRFSPYVGFGYNTKLSSDGKWNLNVDAGVLFWGGSPRVKVHNVYRVDPDDVNDKGTFRYVEFKPGKFQPEAKTTETVDLSRDVYDIPGKVGSWANTISKFKCWPVVGVTLSYNIF